MNPETEIELLKQKIDHLEGWVKDWLRRVASDKESEKMVRREQGKRLDDAIKEVALLKQSKDSSRSVWRDVITVLTLLIALATAAATIIKS